MSEDANGARLQRVKERAMIKRDSYVARITDLYQLAQQAKTDPMMASQILAASRELDVMWAGFQVEDNAVLDALLDLGLSADYSSATIVETGRLVNYIRSVSDHYEAATNADPSGSDIGSAGSRPTSVQTAQAVGVQGRLPEIPLPHFDGDIYKWPAFRDRFVALVEQRAHLSDIEKFYYLIGCLKGEAADAIRGIPISGPTFELAWSTMRSRFDKPRLVAKALVEDLLKVPVSTSESLPELNRFLSIFCEGVAVLGSLRIPDMGDFILFSLASRVLPASTRTLFESQAASEYPTVNELFTFVKSRATILERVQDATSTMRTPTSRVNEVKAVSQAHRKSVKPSQSSLVSATVTNSAPLCKCCDQSHKLESCRNFKSWSVAVRVKWSRARRICFVCLGEGHWANKCNVKSVCALCPRRHHTLLHPETTPAQEDKVAPKEIAGPSAPASLLSGSGIQSVILGTALVHVRDRSGSYQIARALIDSGSQISAITATCVKRLGLRWSRWTTPITGLSGVPVVDVQGRVDCCVLPRFAPDPMLVFDAWVLPTITSHLPRCSLDSSIKNKYSSLALADPDFHISAPVDLLLGADLFATVMDGRRTVVDESLPIAFGSCFGWVLIGPTSHSTMPNFYSGSVSLTTSVEHLMDRFWHVEEPEDAPPQFTAAGRCESIFSKNVVRDGSGRFSVPLPFRVPLSKDSFLGSRAVAEKRFMRLERKLNSDHSLRLKYNEFMAEYLALGHMSVASCPGQYFVPHHAVVGSGDKIRVVFDASAKCPNGMSLNSTLLAGPKLQRDIVDVLTRFRLFRHAFTTDIRQMYRQILMLPEFRPFQHILWRSSVTEELREYELNTVTYGVNCAPFLALRVLQVIADSDCGDFPRVRDALLYQTYVDDICFGADTVKGAVGVQGELIAVLARAGLELRKWASNTSAVLQAVPEEFRVVKSLTFSHDDGHDTKVLGLHWHPVDDVLSCGLRIDSPIIYTKRGVLSLTAQFFDPLGLFAPAIFLAKHIMQRIWQTDCVWDDPLPADIKEEWAQFVSELPELTVVRIPRYFHTSPGSACTLCGFCDASQRGYAAVVYLRVNDAPRESSVFLVGTKTKLAPIKPLTIPRLELNAAVLLSRWMSRVRSILGSHVTIVESNAWTDSQVVLSWLTIPHKNFKQYVSNRVHQIQSLMPDCRWHYVPSGENPADCASRGVMPGMLPHHTLYWQGPEFLHDPPHEWGSDITPLPCTELPEFKPVSLTVSAGEVEPDWFHRFSSFDRMLRVITRVTQFGLKCRRRIVGELPVVRRVDLDESLGKIVALSQLTSFPDLRRELEQGLQVSSKPIARLCPFIDPSGIIRVGGRLRHSSLSFDGKHPILLAKTSHLSLLICRHWHKITCHSGPRVMTALINRQFWIVSLRTVIRTVLSRCTRCVRLRAVNPQPLMADLPASRVQQCRVFMRVGVDYAGPLQMRENKLRKSRTYKAYIAVFVCLTVKAVHLEVVSDLSTDAFLAAFDRFVARRGLPCDIYSDCGTNFVGAAKQLRALVNSSESQRHISAIAGSCTWHFNPPSAPHFGGLWEAAVRSAKRLLHRVMGPHTFTYEEFTTVLCRVEAVLNSRPLTPSSTDPHDFESLTPGHFLITQPLLTVPPRSSPDSSHSLTHRWKLLDQCHQAFWRRWSSEYLHTLQERRKWAVDQPSVEPNNMVVIKDNLAPPLEWTLGRVTEVFAGLDGVVRVARVATARGEVTRPTAKLVVLPTEQSE